MKKFTAIISLVGILFSSTLLPVLQVTAHEELPSGYEFPSIPIELDVPRDDIISGVLPLNATPAKCFEYQNVKGGAKAGGSVIIYGFSEDVESYEDCDTENVIIPDSIDGLPVTTIYSSAFEAEMDGSIKTLVLGNNLTDILYNAFAGNKIQSIVIPNSMIRIRDGAFNYNNLREDNIIFENPNWMNEVKVGYAFTRLIDNCYHYDELTHTLIGYYSDEKNVECGTDIDLTYDHLGVDVQYISSLNLLEQLRSVKISGNVKGIADGAFCVGANDDIGVVEKGGASASFVNTSEKDGEDVIIKENEKMSIPKKSMSDDGDDLVGTEESDFVDEEVTGNLDGGKAMENIETVANPEKGSSLDVQLQDEETGETESHDSNKDESLENAVTENHLEILENLGNIGVSSFPSLLIARNNAIIDSINENGNTALYIDGDLNSNLDEKILGSACLQAVYQVTLKNEKGEVLATIDVIGGSSFENDYTPEERPGYDAVFVDDNGIIYSSSSSVNENLNLTLKYLTSCDEGQERYPEGVCLTPTPRDCFLFDPKPSFTTPAIINGFNEDLKNFENICHPENLVIPNTISVSNGTTYGVRLVGKIRASAFEKYNIKTVVLGSNITEIGDNAFNANKLDRIFIPESVTNIGENAFSFNNIKEENIVFENPNWEDHIEIMGYAFVRSINNDCYAYDELTHTILGHNRECGRDVDLTRDNLGVVVKEIESGAFDGDEIKSLKLPNTITDIKKGTFASNFLEEVEIPDSVGTIGIYAFGDYRYQTCENGLSGSDVVLTGSDAFIKTGYESFTGERPPLLTGFTDDRFPGLRGKKIEDGNQEIMFNPKLEEDTREAPIQNTPEYDEGNGQDLEESNSICEEGFLLKKAILGKNIETIAEGAFCPHGWQRPSLDNNGLIPAEGTDRGGVKPAVEKDYIPAINIVKGIIKRDFSEYEHENWLNYSCLDVERGYVLSFYDGNELIKEVVKTADEELTQSDIISSLTKEGKKLVGWSESKNGGNTYSFSKHLDRDVTLYAQWGNSSSENSLAGGSGRGLKDSAFEITDEESKTTTEKSENPTTKANGYNAKATASSDNVVRVEKLTRGELALMTDILLEVYPELVEGRADVNTACSNYTDQQQFTEKEERAIRRLCKLAIMGIHNDDRTPIPTFEVKKLAENEELYRVINRVIEDFSDEQVGLIRNGLSKINQEEGELRFGTLYDLFMKFKPAFGK